MTISYPYTGEPLQPRQQIEVGLSASTILAIDGSSGRLTVHQAPNLGKVSDGYHSFDELYEHRCLLFAALIASGEGLYPWKSRQHEDGSMFDGWFIAGLVLPTGPITYHMPIAMWDLFHCPELETAPHWDGHTPADVVQRLTGWLKIGPAIADQEF